MGTLLIALIIGSLANQAMIEVVNHGEILQGLRSAIHGWAESLRFPLLRLITTPLRAIHCPFCFSHWTGLFAACIAIPLNLEWWWLFILWLPIVRLSNIYTDIIGDSSRSPGSGINPRLQDARPEDLEVRLMESLGPGWSIVENNEEKHTD